MSQSTRRRLALAAIAGCLLGLLYWPLHALAYFATEDGSEGALKWGDAGRDALEPLLDWDSADTVYVTYGKLALFVVLGVLAGLLTLAPETRLAHWGRRAALTGAVVLAAGVVVEYWVGAVDVGFVIAGPGLLILLVGSTLLGIGLLRSRAPSRAGAWLLAFSIPLLALAVAVLGHLSAGLAALSLAWLLLGRAQVESVASDEPRLRNEG